MKVNAQNPCATGTCPPKNLLPQGYVDMMNQAAGLGGGMGAPFGTMPMLNTNPMPARPMQQQQQRAAAGPSLDPRQLCNDDYAAIAMLPVFGGALARFAGTIPDPVTMLGAGVVAVAQFWQGKQLPACSDPSPLARGCHIGILIARCFVDGEVLGAILRALVAQGLPVRGSGAPAPSHAAPPQQGHPPQANPGG